MDDIKSKMGNWKLVKRLFVTKSSTEKYENTIAVASSQWIISIVYKYRINRFLSKYTVVELKLRCENLYKPCLVQAQMDRAQKDVTRRGTLLAQCEKLGKRTLLGLTPYTFLFEFSGWIGADDTLMGYINIFVDCSRSNAGCSRQDSNFDQLGTDLNCLYYRELFSDLTLQCGGEEFKVHKAILAARSPVFMAMLQTPMKESREDLVVINDISPEVCRAMVHYVYSGYTQQLKSMLNTASACEVLSAADLYGIPGLKKVVTAHLRETMSEQNCLKILTFADVYDAQLKEDVLIYTSLKFDVLRTTQEWDNLRLEKPSLAMDVLAAKIQFLSCA